MEAKGDAGTPGLGEISKSASVSGNPPASDLDDVVLEENISRITIPKTEEGGEKTKFTLYHIEIKMSSGEFVTVKRRYSEFHSLNEMLLLQFGINLNFPSKKLFGVLDATVIEQRRQQLEQYLQDLLKLRDPNLFHSSKELLRFLDPNQLVYLPSTTTSPGFADQGGDLLVQILEGRNIHVAGKKDSNLELLTFFKLENNGEMQASKYFALNTTTHTTFGPNPKWNFERVIPIITLQQRILFRVKNVNLIWLDDLVGTTGFNLRELKSTAPVNMWLKLKKQGKDGKLSEDTGGEIHICLKFIPKKQQPLEGKPLRKLVLSKKSSNALLPQNS